MITSASLTTVADFFALPDPKEGHFELHHGEVVTVPPPSWRHQDLQDRIAALLRAQTGKNGRVIIEMAFQAAPEYEFWLADVGYVTAERAEAMRGRKTGNLQGAPDLVVEVLSPNNTADEIDDRRSTCMANGCRSFWVVNDRRKTISITENGVTRHFGPSSRIESFLFAESDVSVDAIFED